MTQRELQRPLVVTGGPCTGKAVLLAHCAQQVCGLRRKMKYNMSVFTQYVNNSPISTQNTRVRNKYSKLIKTNIQKYRSKTQKDDYL